MFLSFEKQVKIITVLKRCGNYIYQRV